MNLAQWKCGLFAAGFTAATYPALAQDTNTATDPFNSLVPGDTTTQLSTTSPQVSTSTTSAFGTSQRFSQLLNQNLVLSNGQNVGQITDIVVGPRGNLEYLVGTNGGRSFPVPVNAVQMNNNGQAQLNMTPAQFQNVPTFTSNQWPNFDSVQFQNQVFTAFRSALPAGGGLFGQNGTNPNLTATNQPVQNPAYTGGGTTNAAAGTNQTSAAQSGVNPQGTNQSRMAQTGANQANQTGNQNSAATTGSSQVGNTGSAAQRNANQISTDQNRVRGGNPNGVQNNSANTAQQSQLNGTSNTNAGTTTPSDRSVTSQNAAQQRLRGSQIGGIPSRNPAQPVLPNTTPLTPNTAAQSAAQNSQNSLFGNNPAFGNTPPRVGSSLGISGPNGSMNANGVGTGGAVRPGVGNAGTGIGGGVGNAGTGGPGVGNAGVGGTGVGNAGVGGAGVGNAGGAAGAVRP